MPVREKSTNKCKMEKCFLGLTSFLWGGGGGIIPSGGTENGKLYSARINYEQEAHIRKIILAPPFSHFYKIFWCEPKTYALELKMNFRIEEGKGKFEKFPPITFERKISFEWFSACSVTLGYIWEDCMHSIYMKGS